MPNSCPANNKGMDYNNNKIIRKGNITSLPIFTIHIHIILSYYYAICPAPCIFALETN